MRINKDRLSLVIFDAFEQGTKIGRYSINIDKVIAYITDKLDINVMNLLNEPTSKE